MATYRPSLSPLLANARRACWAVRADYKSVLIEIENEVNKPRVSPRSKQARLDAILRIITKARTRVDL